MIYDAVILSGGRGSRLGGISKASLLTGGRPLVVETAAAAAGARVRVVVGEGAPGLPDDVLVMRERPPFGGPAAALGAGMVALESIRDGVAPPELILVLACDMPGISAMVPLLVAAMDDAVGGAIGGAVDGAVDGVIALDAARRQQYLAAVYRRSSLSRALARAQASGSLEGASMRSLLAGLHLAEMIAPDDATADVDTWDDAQRLRVTATTASRTPPNEESNR